MADNLIHDAVLAYYFQQFKEKWRTFKMKELFMDVVRMQKTSVPPEEGTDMSEFLDMMTIFGMKSMDVYYVARMLKNPDENVQPVLALGFFGDFHTRTIVKMLSQAAFGYTVDTVQAADPEFRKYDDPRIVRCVHIARPIPIEREVREHARARDLSRYFNVLRRERTAREFYTAIPFSEYEDIITNDTRLVLTPEEWSSSFGKNGKNGKTKKSRGNARKVGKKVR